MIMSKICRTIPLKLLQYYKNACVPRNFRVIYFYLVFYSLIHPFTSSQPLLREPQCSLPLYTESDYSGESGDLITGNPITRNTSLVFRSPLYKTSRNKEEYELSGKINPTI